VNTSKRIIRLFIIISVTVVVMKTSAFGWRRLEQVDLKFSQQDYLAAQRLRQRVKYLSEDIGIRDYLNYANLEKSARFVEEEFKDLGYTTEIMEYKIDKRLFKNIIATNSKYKKPGPAVIVGAHYDTCSNPGADDNASGVAGLIELAYLLKDEQTGATIKFIAFVNEEPPFFMSQDMGSSVYVRQAKKKREDILGAVILESIGYYRQEPNSQEYPAPLGIFYPNQGNFITMVSNFPSAGMLKILARGFRKASNFPLECFTGPTFIPGVSFSDNWSFWQEGYRAIMVTDTAFLRNPNYHSQADLPHTLDYRKMALVIKGLKSAIIEFANKR